MALSHHGTTYSKLGGFRLWRKPKKGSNAEKFLPFCSSFETAGSKIWKSWSNVVNLKPIQSKLKINVSNHFNQCKFRSNGCRRRANDQINHSRREVADYIVGKLISRCQFYFCLFVCFQFN